MTPADVQVPDGNSVALKIVGAIACDDDGDMDWLFKVPHAALNDGEGSQVGNNAVRYRDREITVDSNAPPKQTTTNIPSMQQWRKTSLFGKPASVWMTVYIS